MKRDSARVFIDATVSELKPLAVASALAEWEASTTGEPAAQREAAKCETELRLFLASRDRHERTVESLESNPGADPLTRRQLRLLYLDQVENQLPRETIEDLVRRAKNIQAEFYTFRAELDGRPVTNNAILDVLREERKTPRRRAAWEASKGIGPRVAGPLLELVERRNEAARSLGYRDYYAMRLELQEIDEDELFRVFGELKDRTDRPFRDAKRDIDDRLAQRFEITPEELRPWHYDDPFFQEPPLVDELGLGPKFEGRDLLKIARDFFANVGLPIDDVLARSDLYERDGKDQHAYCTNIDREGDVRILCNLKDDERWMGILLHELGHAAFEKGFPPSLPWLLRQPAHIATTEAVAMFMDRLIFDAGWLQRAAGISLEHPDQLQRDAFRALRFEMLLMARWVLVMTTFERDLYADPRQPDLDDHWWDLVETLQLLPRPEGRQAPDWAAKIHLTAAPVYYHNYLLGELIASQLGAAIERRALAGRAADGYVDCPELGGFLRERWFAPGASIHWQELLESATGSPLTPEPFLNDFVAGEI
ncbi:MAG: peptidase M3A and M3B thimet/oligopeptidase F [Gemmatimonadetes bacterium]|nr:peptidase M3A and M3B thimet/oligopeptidase F [Gemmatimonadota bacterium]